MKKPPHFATEDDERQFWATHDADDDVDLSRARRTAFPNLKPSTQTISIRLPVSLLEDRKLLANTIDVPYQSLMKMLLAQAVEGKKRAPAGG